MGRNTLTKERKLKMVMKYDEDKNMLTFSGKVMWCSIPPNKPRGPAEDDISEKNKNDLKYSIEVECSEKEFEFLQKKKIPPLSYLREYEGVKGKYLRIYATKVKTNLSNKNGGQDYEFKDVPVYSDKFGTKADVAASNGSEAIVRAELADGKRGSILRLKGVMFTNLIPYEPKQSNVFDDMFETEDPAEEEGNPFEGYESGDSDVGDSSDEFNL